MTRTALRRFPRSGALASCALLISAVFAFAAPPPIPGDARRDQAEQPKTLEVAPEHAAMGDVIYIVPGKPGDNIDQTRFTNTPPDSDRDVDHFTGFTNKIIGYAVVESMGDPANLVAGEFRLPVESLDTGIRGRNRHLQNRQWLNAREHPHIAFKIKRTRNIRTKSESSQGTVYEADLVGDMTIHGVTKEMTIPIEVTSINAGDRGQLIRVRTSYTVTLSDFGVANNIIGKRVANRIALEQYLVFSPTKPA